MSREGPSGYLSQWLPRGCARAMRCPIVEQVTSGPGLWIAHSDSTNYHVACRGEAR